MRNHEEFKMSSVAHLTPPASREQAHQVEAANTRAYLSRYEVDRRSIFVGNLPLGTTDQEIRGLFQYYGMIEAVTVRESLSRFDGKP